MGAVKNRTPYTEELYPCRLDLNQRVGESRDLTAVITMGNMCTDVVAFFLLRWFVTCCRLARAPKTSGGSRAVLEDYREACQQIWERQLEGLRSTSVGGAGGGADDGSDDGKVRGKRRLVILCYGVDSVCACLCVMIHVY